MQDQMTYRKAKKLNAVFLLLLLATENTSSKDHGIIEDQIKTAGSTKSQEYFDQKFKEFERDKYRF